MTIRPTLRCPCEGRFLAPAFVYDSPPPGETRFALGSQAYRRAYDRCAICVHWFGRHDLDLTRLYAHDYVDATYGGLDGMRQRFEKIMALPPEQSDNRQRVARILRYWHEAGSPASSTRPRLLDVGAGLGVFPAAMVEVGWRVTALEPDLRSVEHLRGLPGIEASGADLLDVDPSALGAFDAITFNKVLEHVEDPVALLRAAAGLLEATGFIYLELPDVAAAADGPGREEFFIEHHHVFSAASFVLLSERSGLAPSIVERVREPSGKFTLRGFLTQRPSDRQHG